MPTPPSDTLLNKAAIIPPDLCKSLRAMTGFRNVAIHEYQELDNDILRYIAPKGFLDFVLFCEALGLKIKKQPS